MNFMINGEYGALWVKPQGEQIDHVALSYGYGNKKTKELTYILLGKDCSSSSSIIFISSY